MRQFFLWLLLWWIVGIAAGQWLAGYSILFFVVGILALGCYLRLVIPLLVAGTLLFALGFIYGQPVEENLANCPQQVPMEGIVVGAPRLLADRGQYIVESAPYCRIQVTVARFPAYAEGDHLRLDQAKLRPLSTLENAGYAAYLRRQGIFATTQYPTLTRMSISQGSWATRWVEPVITRVFLEPDAGVIRALLLANTDGLPTHLQENFRATGLSHLLAISGMNISMLAGILISVLYLMPLSPLSRTIIISSLLWGYMALIGWPISAVRATFFWTIALVALRLHLLVSLPTVLLLTLIIMLSLNPLLASDVGFQLSVAAVAGIFLTHFLTKRYFVAAPLFLKVIAASLLVTLGATIATGPIIAYHFGTLSLLSVPANLVVAPVVMVQMVAGIVTVMFGLVFPAAALLPAFVFHLTVVWMDVVSATLTGFNSFYVQGLMVPSWFVAGYYCAIFACAYWWLRWQKRSWRELWQ